MFGIIDGIRKRLKHWMMRRKLPNLPETSSIARHCIITGGSNIYVGSHSQIADYSWLMAVPLTNYKVKLSVGNSCNIGMFAHIIATRSISIEDGVLMAQGVYISDNLHGYEDINTYPLQQPLVQKNDVVIGEGTWLGERVSVIGAKIGKHCVIGTGALVLNDIPAYCVAVGMPAYIIKRYCFDTNTWRKTDPKGNFID